MEMVDINTNDTDRTKYKIELLRRKTMIITKELLNPINVPDIGYIPIFSEDYINESNNFTQEKKLENNVSRSAITFKT